MTTAQYLRAIKRLGLTPSGKATAEAFGLSLRQCQRIAAGDDPVTPMLERLIAALLDNKRLRSLLDRHQ